ncbi:MAG: glycosyltransferase [Actinomycetota bacterium]|nr:glycosyltransferase [Actinomycetota bacterium]
MAPALLHVQVECEVPNELVVGAGTAVFVCGWCFSPGDRIASLSLVVGGQHQPAMAHSMPRLDPFTVLHPTLDPFEAPKRGGDPSSGVDPRLHSYRSGFWGIARIEAGQAAGGVVRLALRAELVGGDQATAELAQIRVLEPPSRLESAWPSGALAQKVAICMATYNPPPDLLELQLRSIREQTHANWLCVISDDCSSGDGRAAIERAIAGDPRFLLSRSPRRLGFYRNFERALSLAPAGAEYVAMADQDDRWRPEKLEALLAGIGEAQLVYSDARVVSRTGEVISDTWWSRRDNNHADLLSLLVANSVTGAASLVRADVVECALPFPPAQFAHFHDHWVALVALARGEIAFIDRALYDYVQHESASLGHAAANRMPSLRDRLTHRRPLRDRVRMWRLHYFADLCRLAQLAIVLDMRFGHIMTSRKRRTIERLLAPDRSPALLALLGLRGARELVGRSETLGAEWMLFHALAWRHLLAASARDLPQRRLRLDALPPTPLSQQPGHVELHNVARVAADKIAPLRWTVSEDAPARVNLLIPTIDLRHFFGGYIAKLNLARRLAERGKRVRIVTVDPVGALPPGWRGTLESFSGLQGLFSRVETVFGRESTGIECSVHDSFIATTWWTAHIAHDALRATGGERFVYLIQEYEPFTFAMGSYAALANQSYAFPHFALFSTDMLRGYFRAHEIGVYRAGTTAGDRASAAFENAITPVSAPRIAELENRRPRRLLFYARPEPHAARNMFELGLLALVRALEQGAFVGDWELNGIGTVEPARRISLGGGGGAALKLLPRADQQAYANLLREHDVGLALMYTPHPGLVPIEMASAGMLTVTNTFETKTAAALSAISSNLIAAEPTVECLSAALVTAASGAGDLARRASGSQVRWSASWDRSFDDELLSLAMTSLGERVRVA